MQYSLKGDYPDLLSEEMTFEEFNKSGIHTITVVSVEGKMDEMTGGYVKVCLSNNWIVNLYYNANSKLNIIFNNKVMFEEKTDDCFTGEGICADVEYAITTLINKLLNIE